MIGSTAAVGGATPAVVGLPYVLGYQPRGNYQSALRATVEPLLVRDTEIPPLLEKMPVPDVPPAAQLDEVDPPVMTPASVSGPGRTTTVVIDYLERHARNRDVGLRGERLVFDYERRWLLERGRPDLADRVVHVSVELGHGAGYDVSSFLLDETPHHIEVKATRGSISAPFLLSANELRHALEHPGCTRSTAYSTWARVRGSTSSPGTCRRSLTSHPCRIRRGSRYPERGPRLATWVSMSSNDGRRQH